MRINREIIAYQQREGGRGWGGGGARRCCAQNATAPDGPVRREHRERVDGLSPKNGSSQGRDRLTCAEFTRPRWHAAPRATAPLGHRVSGEKRNIITASIYDKHSVGPSIRSDCTR